MNPNQVFMYSQTPSPIFLAPGMDKSMVSQGYPSMPTPGALPNFTLMAPSMTPSSSESMQLLQVPCAPQMMQPYQLISFPAPGIHSVVTPMMQTPPPMPVYNPIQRQSHPLMQEENRQPLLSQNGPVDGNFQQWKRDPSFQWGQDQSYSQPPTLNSNLHLNNGMKFNHSNRNLKGSNRHDNYPRKSKKKFGFRSKQNMIDKVYLSLVEKYEKRGILAGDDEVLRGDDTIRLHVKKFKALQRIEEALQAAERIDSVTISRVSIPLSMKNQFQKKGFLVYVQVEEVWMVPLAQKIFRQFDEFKKCDVARHTVDAEVKEEETSQAVAETVNMKADAGSMVANPMDTEEESHEGDAINTTINVPERVFEAAVKEVREELLPKTDDLEDFDDLFAGPMIPQRSCGEMGQ